MTDNTWRQDAACLDTDPAAFFPEGQSNDVSYAKRVCQRCPVNAVIGCAREAVAIESTDITLCGVWAGIRVAQSSSSRTTAIKELHSIAGIPYVEPEKKDKAGQRPCDSCQRQMRDRNTNLADKPGTVRHRGQGLCDSCHRTAFGDTTIRPAAVPA